jgi:uracil-DNA glycosylase family 4
VVRDLPALHREIVRCEACDRLVRWRRQVAREKVRRFRNCDYWGKPVPGFGDPDGRILLVGLAPAAHGANRTGRMFTGDRSGDFLFSAMHRAGLASQPNSTSRRDGLVLRDAYIVATIRCAPPANRPRPDETANCVRFFDAELALLRNVRVLLALGAIAWRACLDHLARGNLSLRPRPPFAHGAWVPVGSLVLMGSFHVSQQNTQTGRLTPAMFDTVLAAAKQHAARRPVHEP